LRIGIFKEQRKRLFQIVPRQFDAASLARDIHLRTERDVSGSVAFDDCRQFHGLGGPAPFRLFDQRFRWNAEFAVQPLDHGKR
jgi:hypothetical protein